MTGRILLFTVLALTGAARPATAACVWEFGSSFPLFPPHRKQAAAVNENGRIVALGGRPFVGGGEQAPVHFLEPPDYLVWQSGVPLEQAVMQPAAGVDSFGRILVAGGWSVDDTGGGFFPTNSSFVYDLGSGNIGGISPFTCSRARFAFATDDLGRLYLFGGLDIDLITQDCVERYDAGIDTWSPLASLPQPLSGAAAVYDGVGHILVIGGADPVGVTQATVYSYDIAGDTWTTIDPEPVALERQAAVLGADGRVYVVGGFSSNFPTSFVFIYDPATTLWSTGPSLNIARWGGAITLGDDDFIYALGGFTSGSTATNTVERLGTGLLGNDCNSNGVPDECEPDCQPNGVPDDCDIDPSDPDGNGEISDDINGNGVPDECDECVQHTDCDDAVDCTVDTCDPATWTCSNVPNASACDNGVFCDGAETCHPTTGCQPGVPPNCSDGITCTVDTCDLILDDCVHLPDDSACDNSLFCDSTETFHVSLGCQPGTAIDCDDGVTCTDDSCNETTDSCDYVPNDTNCDNGLYCDGAETCDAVLDCQPGTAIDCGDGVGRTEDSCNETTDSCDSAPRDALCDNGLFCDGVETCDPDLDCRPGSNPCPDQECDEDANRCQNCQTNADCDDDAGCTIDTCDANGNCQYQDTCSDDGLFCNGDEFCNVQAGVCDHTGDPCPPGCDEVNDTCASCETPIVEAAGSRYIAITPQPEATTELMTFVVSSPDWPCLDKYVGGLLKCSDTGTRCFTDADCNYCTGPWGSPCLVDDDCKTCTDAGESPCGTDDDCPPGDTCAQVEACVVTGNTCEPHTPLDTIDINADGEPDGVLASLVDDPADAVWATPTGWGAGMRRCSIALNPCVTDDDCDVGRCSSTGLTCSISVGTCSNVCTISGQECDTDAQCIEGPDDLCTVPQVCGPYETCQRGKVYVTGADVLPSEKDGSTTLPTRYGVRAECGHVVTDPADVTMRVWADTDANEVVNFSDVQFIIFGFQSDFKIGIPPRTMVSVDLVSSAPCVPEQVINFTDIFRAVKAFQGQRYVPDILDSSAVCNVPCP